ncbi:MAG: HAMP domain-containing sensor histidine kinase [Syntrophotaleaceae bacterium]
MGDSCRRISRIVNDLKDFVRTDSEHTYELVDLNQVASTTVRLTFSLVKKSTVHFRFDPAPSLPPIKGNFQQLEQVIINLIVNACQALQKKSQGILLKTHYDEKNRCCVVEVSDQGEGIDPHLLPHITEPFFTTKRHKGGTGLGLSVSSRIAAEHGGKLVFSSKPQEGTTVRLVLPAVNEGKTP